MEERTLRIRVKPGSKKGTSVEELPPGGDAELLVTVRERAIDGKANAAVERALADWLDVPPSRVEIVRGHTARVKTVRVSA